MHAGGFLMMVNRDGRLTPEQGTLRIEEGGVAIQVLSEKGLECPSRGGTVAIEGEGSDVQKIAWIPVVSGFAVLIAAGIWCGRKVFREKS